MGGPCVRTDQWTQDGSNSVEISDTDSPFIYALVTVSLHLLGKSVWGFVERKQNSFDFEHTLYGFVPDYTLISGSVGGNLATLTKTGRS